jgi:serine/threonine protein kinase
LPEHSILQILYSFLCCLKFIHQAGIMHRDIKPNNLLVGPDFSVRLCDFGYSRTSQDQRTIDERITKAPLTDYSNLNMRQPPVRRRSLSPHVICRQFRPPEIILVEPNYNSKVDIWSGGCILAYLLDHLQSKPGQVPNPIVLFRGRKCHPLSPLQRGMAWVDDQDQMACIL